MDIAAKLSEELKIEKWQAEAVIKLIDEGNTIPFIARYRKEQHGSLDDTAIRTLSERLTYLRGLEERKETVRASIEEQGKMTPELQKAIEAAETMVTLEDIYRPYKQKRRTRATVAKEKGLEPLAELILAQETGDPLEASAATYVSEEKGVPSAKDAIAGAEDIIAEQISDNAMFREGIRNYTRNKGILVSKAKDPETKSVYEMYYDFQEPVSKITGYRVLAINRGEKEKILNVKIEVEERQVILYLGHYLIKKNNPNTMPALIDAIEDSYRRLIRPAIEREIRSELTEKAEDGAIQVFDKNLTQLLMQPPITGQVVLGWDPGYAHGSKLAVVDATGKVLDTAIIYPVARYAGGKVNPKELENAKNVVKHLIAKYHVTLISLGNGTASRECEQVVVDILKEIPVKVQYMITNEAGASVYSASKLAAEEFPDFDVEQRGAASMARRVQDPLAELVKIDPKAIGVGQYQHDMNQKKLDEALSGVVEDCVNKVGVDLNTASAPLMEHISGITKTIARNIVAYRDENGRFRTRKDLLKVPKLGPKAYEQCAGFMRIAGGSEPLDNTGVHPESYGAADELIQKLGLKKEEVFAGTVTGAGYGQQAGEGQNAGDSRKSETGDSANELHKSGTREGIEDGRQGDGRQGNGHQGDGYQEDGHQGDGYQGGGRQGDGGQGDGRQEDRHQGDGRQGDGYQGDGHQTRIGQNSERTAGNLVRGSRMKNKIKVVVHDYSKMAEVLGIGEPTLRDIVKELNAPGRDPREDMPKPVLRSDVLRMEDLKVGMVLKGTVRNVIDFGAFVDIGVHQDGLVHISEMSDKKFVKHPLDVVSVGDVVDVKVISVDLEKKRIGLSMRGLGK